MIGVCLVCETHQPQGMWCGLCRRETSVVDASQCDHHVPLPKKTLGTKKKRKARR